MIFVQCAPPPDALHVVKFKDRRAPLVGNLDVDLYPSDPSVEIYPNIPIVLYKRTTDI